MTDLALARAHSEIDCDCPPGFPCTFRNRLTASCASISIARLRTVTRVPVTAGRDQIETHVISDTRRAARRRGAAPRRGCGRQPAAHSPLREPHGEPAEVNHRRFLPQSPLTPERERHDGRRSTRSQVSCAVLPRVYATGSNTLYRRGGATNHRTQNGCPGVFLGLHRVCIYKKVK